MSIYRFGVTASSRKAEAAFKALHDIRAIGRMNVREAAKVAKVAGVREEDVKRAVRDRDAPGLAHLAVCKEYGQRTYRAALKILFNQ